MFIVIFWGLLMTLNFTALASGAAKPHVMGTKWQKCPFPNWHLLRLCQSNSTHQEGTLIVCFLQILAELGQLYKNLRPLKVGTQFKTNDEISSLLSEVEEMAPASSCQICEQLLQLQTNFRFQQTSPENEEKIMAFISLNCCICPTLSSTDSDLRLQKCLLAHIFTKVNKTNNATYRSFMHCRVRRSLLQALNIYKPPISSISQINTEKCPLSLRPASQSLLLQSWEKVDNTFDQKYDMSKARYPNFTDSLRISGQNAEAGDQRKISGFLDAFNNITRTTHPEQFVKLMVLLQVPRDQNSDVSGPKDDIIKPFREEDQRDFSRLSSHGVQVHLGITASLVTEQLRAMEGIQDNTGAENPRKQDELIPGETSDPHGFPPDSEMGKYSGSSKLAKGSKPLNLAFADHKITRRLSHDLLVKKSEESVSSSSGSNNNLLVTSSETCRHSIETRLVAIPGCVRKSLLLTRCHGSCPSRSVPNWNREGEQLRLVEHCTCCSAHVMKFRTVNFTCPGRRVQTLVRRIGFPFRCVCRPCANVPEVTAEQP